MNLRTAPVLLFVLALIALLGIIVLTLAGVDSPRVLEYVVLTATGGAAGAALPSATTRVVEPRR